METLKNVYESGEAPEGERERLKKLEYPTWVSEECIGEDIKGKTILDVGSGPNVALNKFAKDHGASYVAFDIEERFLRDQQKESAMAVKGSALALPFKEQAAEIVHMRFVLRFFSPEQRAKAIQEAVRAAKERTLLVEYDWDTFRGGERVNKFVAFSLRLMAKAGVEAFMGKKLKEEVENLLPEKKNMIREQRFSREAGTYYEELFALVPLTKKVIERVNDPALAKEFDGIVLELEEESHKENPEQFTRPDIVVVEVPTK